MIVTFYSFKGGVGRSMALANVGELLAQWGYSVIVCDWDLEAPGLERYLEEREERISEFRAKPGIIDLVTEYKDTLANPITAVRQVPAPDGFEVVGDCILRQPHTWAVPLVRDTAKTRGSILLLPAGRRDAEWAARYDRAVTGMDWTDFYETWAGGSYFEFFREDLNANADIVLIDSRTGVTELGGICTQHLADMILIFTTTNDQSLEGAKRMVRSLERPQVTQYRNGRLLGVLPIASRVDTRSEINEVLEFKKRFTRAFGELVARNTRQESRFLELSLIPYVGLYSYAERSVARLPEEDRDLDLIKPYHAIAEALVEWGAEFANLRKIEVAADSAARVMLDVLAKERRYIRPAVPRGEIYLAWAPGEQERAAALANSLREGGMNVWCDALPERAHRDIRSAANRLTVIERSAGYILLVPHDFDMLWLEAEANAILARWASKNGYRPLVIGPEARFQSSLQVARIPSLGAPDAITQELVEAVMTAVSGIRSVLEEPVEGPALDFLHSPDEAHSRFMLGRDNALRSLLAEVEEMTNAGRFALVVLGDLGSSDTELMRAGLAPSLHRRLVGRERRSWQVVYVCLREEPTREVLGAFAEVTQMSAGKGLPADVDELLRWVEGNSDSVALVIDSAERLTCQGWEEKRLALFELIGKLRAAGAGRFFLIISERGDLKSKLQLVCPPEWGEVKTWKSPIFDEQGIRDFLTAGAKLFGVVWETDTLDRAVNETASFRATPRITGLLMRETLSQRDGRTITFKNYVQMGGVEQVIANYAGKMLSRLAGDTQDGAKRIILRLVSTPGRTKRTLAFDDLIVLAGAGVERQNAIVYLLDQGILGVDVREAYALRTSRIADVEPVRTWFEAEAESVITTARLEQAVEEWEQSERAPSATARGAALLEFERVTPLLQKEKEFLTHSREMERIPSPVHGGKSVRSNIPDRNPFFTGREQVLSQLQEALVAQGRAALSGLGGVGKTQTALEYAHRHLDEYACTFWVTAHSREALFSGYNTIAGLLKLPLADAKDQTLAVGGVQRWLNSYESWLLILDNADDLAMAREFIPDGKNGHVILTTSARAVGALARLVEVQEMGAEEGAVLVLRRAKYIAEDASLETAVEADQAMAKEIVTRLGGLPLALDQAAAYVEETGCGLSGYLDIYRRHAPELLRLRGELGAGHTDPVATTWALSFENIEKTNPAAAELLCFCALLHPVGIPEEVLSKGANELGPALAAVGTDALLLNRALSEILKYSLLRRDPNACTFEMHRLVQIVLKQRMDESTQRRWAERAVRAINRAFPNVEFSTWALCERLLPQVRVCAELIDQWGFEFPEAARLLNEAGIYLCERGHYPDAEPLYHRALEIRKKVLGPEHPDVATSLNRLAELNKTLGQLAKSEPLYERALAIREKVLGPEHPDVAESLNNLAELNKALGQYAKSESLYGRALAIWEGALGPEHPNVATGLNNMARLYAAQGQYEKAEPLDERALAIREKVLSPEHPEVAQSLSNLAAQYYSQQRYAKAESFNERALAIREKALGPEHPDVATSLNNLAGLYDAKTQYAKAEPLYRRALAIWEKALGPEHSDVAMSLNNLAKLYDNQGQHAKAQPLYERALAIWEGALDPEHPNVARSLNNLARLYVAQGQYARAEPLYRQALAIREKALEPDHPDVAISLENYASLLRKMGRTDEVAPLESRAKGIRDKHAQAPAREPNL
jgi:tetratricopeptide (TPR) repeat protein/MinD-like ATPase involved in chromosome partitioning or flagellar assembly